MSGALRLIESLPTSTRSLEPGLLAAYEISPFSMLHGEVKYWIPIAGDSKHAGDVVQYGLGFAHVHGATPLGSNSTPLAVIPTIELNAWEFLDGLQTVGNDDTDPATGTTVINVQAGVRCAIGEKVELGSSVSFPLTDSRLYASRFRFEIRWLR